jgi:hypothetical protein
LDSPAQEWDAVWQSFCDAAAMPKHFSAANWGVGAGPALARSGNATTAAKAAAANERDLLSNSMTYSFGLVESGREKVLVVAPLADARTPAKQSVVHRSGGRHM